MAKTTFFMTVVVLLTWSMGLAQVADAEPYGATKTLKEWGVPNYHGRPLEGPGEWINISDEIPGAETKLKWYRIYTTLVGVFSITIREKEMEYIVRIMPYTGNENEIITLVDLNGNGYFVQDMDRKINDVPDWVINEYKKSINSHLVFTTKNSKTYHKLNCSRLNSTDLIIIVDSPQEARESGEEPCKDCNP